ncbi:MAG: ABC transporter permease [Eubacteriales bacterium]|nr:ABC transporter permease [Eubacteriales bacterium]
MPDNIQNAVPSSSYHRTNHYRGRITQIRIFLVRLFRLFFYQNDWKVLPMSALVAGLVAMVIRVSMFVTMEGSLLGAFALACVALWNGCFNSIQTIVRERDVIKREHRSGMHISSYIIANVLYQAMLCFVQTILTMYVCLRMGIKFPENGMFTSSMVMDVAISIFLITFAADMLSLMLSCMVHTTTAAMTLMPFVLIFQLVFSGGLFSLPEWGQSMTGLTISGSGMKCIAAQADYNNLPMVTGWNALFKMRKENVRITVKLGQVLDFLSENNNKSIVEFREKDIGGGFTAGDMLEMMNASPEIQASRDEEVTVETTVGELIDMVGENKVRDLIQSRTAQASQVQAYEKTKANIGGYWGDLLLHCMVYILVATVFLEFIDKDKR